ncbi:MAG: hypothetical protein LBS89_08370 [Zoogloeaceae bacterium]|jgi:hypothetical protein|nr:hypothetical protein [Zoogloeaceae bacterium]
MIFNPLALAKTLPLNLVADTHPKMSALIQATYAHQQIPPRRVKFWAVFGAAFPKVECYFAIASFILWTWLAHHIAYAPMEFAPKGAVIFAMTAALLLFPLWNCFRFPQARYKALRHGQKVTVQIQRGQTFKKICLLEGASHAGQPFRFYLESAGFVETEEKRALELDVLATADASSAVLLEKRFRRI